MSRDEVLKIVDTQGMIWITANSSYALDNIILQLVDDGILETFSNTIIDNNCAFIRKGNPLGIDEL